MDNRSCRSLLSRCGGYWGELFLGSSLEFYRIEGIARTDNSVRAFSLSSFYLTLWVGRLDSGETLIEKAMTFFYLTGAQLRVSFGCVRQRVAISAFLPHYCLSWSYSLYGYVDD